MLNLVWRKGLASFRVTKDKLWHQIANSSSSSSPYFKADSPTERQEEEATFFGKLTSLLAYAPTQVRNRIYLGNALHAADWHLLKELEVGLIVNVTKEIPNYFESDPKFEYLQHLVLDTKDSSILPFLEPSYQKIAAFLQDKPSHSIFIHCYMGSSRSVSVVAYFLMRHEGISAEEAIRYLKSIRPIVNINKKFYDELSQSGIDLSP